MAEIIYRIPSRTVQYGYVEIKFHADEFPDAAMDAAHYVNYVYAFQKEEEATIRRLKETPPGDPQAATERLTAGRKPRTVDEANEMARQVIERELGPTTDVTKAPWNSKVDAKPKPWEAGTQASAGEVANLGDDW